MRFRRALASLAVLLLAGAAAFAASGCGASATLDPVAQAAEASSHTDGFRFALTMDLSVPGLTNRLAVNGTGAFNLHPEEGRLAMTIGGLPQEALAKLHSSSLSFTEVLKDGSAYMGSPAFSLIASGKQWIKLDIQSVIEAEGLNPASITSGSPDPSQYLKYLEAAGAKMTAAGHAQIHGVPTTKWSGTIDLFKAVAAEKLSGSSTYLQKLESELGPGGHDVPVAVWIDAHHLVRRMTMRLAFTIEGNHTGGSLQMDFLEYGAVPPVTAPASSEVLDLTKQAEQGLASSG